MEKRETLTLLVGMQTGTVPMKNSVEIPEKTGNLGIEMPYDPAIPLLGIHPKEIRIEKTRVPQCSPQHCLQYLGHGSSLDVHRQGNG